MYFKSVVFALLTTIFLFHNAYAWEASLPDSALGKSLVLVDKGKGEFFYLEKDGEKITQLHYPSIHGEIEGDKQVEGDLKTPEGVYFVRGKIQIPLDFEMYGNHAYALNYPNPVDKLKGKTGGGIWLHSKGNPIKGQVTQGCVAIDLADIKTLDDYLQTGTPVLIAQSIRSGFHKKAELPLEKRTTNVAITHRERDGKVITTNEMEKAEEKSGLEEAITEEEEETNLFSPRILSPTDTDKENEVTAESLLGDQEKQSIQKEDHSIYVPDNVPLSEETSFIYQATIDWNNAWAGRSQDFFNFYNQEAYTKTEGSFAKFKAQKQSLFKLLSWIYIVYDDIEVLEGPDYYVSWFKQYYVAPNHKTEGIRRLYWMKDENAQYKIVAMEWIPKAVHLEHRLDNKIKQEIPLLVEDWRNAWEVADIETYLAFYSPYALQDSRKGIKEIREQKQRIWNSKQPKKVIFKDIKMEMEKEGLRVEMKQEYEDSTGYKDIGIKILLLHPTETGWQIYKETWRRL